jgi:hypothetical protein
VLRSRCFRILRIYFAWHSPDACWCRTYVCQCSACRPKSLARRRIWLAFPIPITWGLPRSPTTSWVSRTPRAPGSPLSSPVATRRWPSYFVDELKGGRVGAVLWFVMRNLERIPSTTLDGPATEAMIAASRTARPRRRWQRVGRRGAAVSLETQYVKCCYVTARYGLGAFTDALAAGVR